MEKETIFKLRTTGLNKTEFKSKFEVEVEKVFGDTIYKLERLGLIENNKKFIKLTYYGKLFTINIFSQFQHQGFVRKILRNLNLTF